MPEYYLSEAQMNRVDKVKARLIEIFKRKSPPKEDPYVKVLDKVNKALDEENKEIRPYSKSGLPGGLLYLKKDIPTIIVPDIHARIDFFLNIMFFKFQNNVTVLEMLALNKLQVVCVGDGFHAEARAYDRWQLAFEEYNEEFERHKNMDEEMKESLGVMEMVMEIKINFPDNFHFLKGNHENISNERGEGNYPFRKFAYEGPMVISYIEKFYSEDFLLKYYVFEKNLPLLAVGKNFIVSHSEPQSLYKKDQLVDYRFNSDLIKGLTWTDNNQADANSVIDMLNYYLEEEEVKKSFYFGGHRPVSELYNPRAKGKYIQIHNPNKFIIVIIKSNKDIILDEDIIELNDRTKEILRNYKD